MGYLLSATHPNYKLFLIVLSGIIAIALTSALIGCLTSKCFEVCQSRRKRDQSDIEMAQPVVITPTVNSSASSITLNGVDTYDDIIEERTENLLAQKIFVGREAEEYRKKIHSNQGIEIMQPVLFADPSKITRRSCSSGSGKGYHLQVGTAVEAMAAQRKENVLTGTSC